MGPVAETVRASRDTARLKRGTRPGRARSTTTAPPRAVRPVAPATVTPRLRSRSSVSPASSVSPSGSWTRKGSEHLVHRPGRTRDPGAAGRDDGQLGLEHDPEGAQRGAGGVEVGGGDVAQAP